MSDRVAIVTGAASGLGAATVDALREQGWRVGGIDLAFADAAEHSVTADVADPTQVQRAVNEIEERLGPTDALVSAAGHYAETPLLDITPEEWTRMLRVHLGGLRNAVHAALPGMLDRRHGSIVAITSELAIGGADAGAHYAAVKGAMIGFVRSLAIEVAHRGVRVNSVAPGPADTPLLAPDSPWRRPEYLATLPARRLSRPDEIAAAVCFLLTEADFVVGEVLSINSGAVI